MKRIFSSSIMVMATLAIVIGGTGAFFSDTETSEGNVFTAGAIDLMVNHTAATYNGIECGTCEVTIQSDTTNQVVEKDGETIDPYNAVQPDDPADDWAAEFNDAVWIWGEAEMPDSQDNTQYTFQNTFEWFGSVGSADITFTLAADDDYEVFLNGESVATGDDAWQNTETITLDAGDIDQGENVIEFVVTNSGAYRAGLLYELQILRDGCENSFEQFQAQCELWESKDLASESFFDFSDLKPQDEGTNLVSLTVEDNESYMCLNVTNQENEENDRISPEEEAGDDSDDEGELGQFLNVMGWYADSNGDTTGSLFGPTAADDLGAIAYADSTTGNGTVTPGDTNYVKLGWCMGDMTDEGNGEYSCDGNVVDINQAQTDEFLADLEFHAVQSRNNDDFSCAEYFGSGDDGDDSIGCTDEADVMLVLDSSGSISPSEMDSVKTDAKNFAASLNPSANGINIGVVDFDNDGTLEQSLTDDLTAIDSAIDGLIDGGTTAMGEGITVAQTELDNSSRNVPQFMIIITDGEPSNDTAATNAATAAKAAGTDIFAIGVGSGADATYLQNSIVSIPSSDFYFQADDFSAVQAEFDEILSCDVQ